MSAPSPERLAAWRSLLEAHSLLVERLEHDLMTERDLPLSWYDVLLNLNEAGGRQRMQDLARSVLLSKSGLTRLADRMEAAGLIRREPCPSDRRGTLAVLTPEGKAALRRAAPVHLRGIEEYFAGHVTDAEAAVIHRALQRVIDASGGLASAAESGGVASAAESGESDTEDDRAADAG